MSTPLFKRIVTFAYEDTERGELMRKVWSATPYVIDCYTGTFGCHRENQMRHWLNENFGDEARPIHERAGRWQFGSATVYGWTWLGFSTEGELNEFLSHFPSAAKDERGNPCPK